MDSFKTLEYVVTTFQRWWWWRLCMHVHTVFSYLSLRTTCWVFILRFSKHTKGFWFFSPLKLYYTRINDNRSSNQRVTAYSVQYYWLFEMFAVVFIGLNWPRNNRCCSDCRVDHILTTFNFEVHLYRYFESMWSV